MNDITSYSTPYVAIVILNWNGSAMIEKYLPSVIEHSKGAEIIVADNASTDDSMDILSRNFPTVRTIRLERNWGFADGYNKAFEVLDKENESMKKEQPEYYLLLNSDVRVEKGWLEPMLSYMNAHSDVAACQPKLLSDLEPEKFEYAGACGGFIDRFGYPYCRGRIFDTVEEDHGQYDTIADIAWATGACMMIRRNDYWNAGGLDGRFFAHNEEIDLCWRLHLLGRRIVCIPQSRAYHLGGGTLPKSNPRKTFLNFRNNLTMMYKNMPISQQRSRLHIARTLLDWVAIIKMLILDRNMKEVQAVINARKEFYKWRHDFDEDRSRFDEETKQKNNVCSNESILFNYYFRSRKTYK